MACFRLAIIFRLTIPIPILAPVQGGPVDCIGGPVDPFTGRLETPPHPLEKNDWKIVGLFWAIFTQITKGKVIGKNTKILMAIFGNFMVKMYLNNICNSLIDFLLYFRIIKSRFHYFRSP